MQVFMKGLTLHVKKKKEAVPDRCCQVSMSPYQGILFKYNTCPSICSSQSNEATTKNKLLVF